MVNHRLQVCFSSTNTLYTFILALPLHQVVIGVRLVDAQDAVDGVGGGVAQVAVVHDVGVAGGRARAAVPAVLRLLRGLVPHDAVDAGDARHAVLVTHALGQQPVPDLPGEHGRVLLLVFTDGVHHGGRGHLGLAAADYPGFVVPSLVIPAHMPHIKCLSLDLDM